MLESPVKYLYHFRRGARLAHKPIDGPLRAGMQCGYAVTYFKDEDTLCHHITQHPYSEVIQRNTWKVGTSAISPPRLADMQKKWRSLDPRHPDYLVNVWDPYDLPYKSRASKYQGDCKKLVAGHCEFMTRAIIQYEINKKLAFLLIPLIHGFDGPAEELERHLSWMVTSAGGIVINDKNRVKEKKARAPKTNALMEMADSLVDKLLPLPPALSERGFLTHPAQRLVYALT
jgi:hypothetical protein